MSDMSRPGPLPTAPDHQLHDPLLIAQITAGDSLDPDQQREGEWLVSSCGACAALADELRAVSGAVAWEPTPPRRRDFRISPEQAEKLQGNAVTRFMRRLALPSSNALRPAAAGVLSIGLVFMLAGTVWPGDSGQQLSADDASLPTVMASAPPLPAAVGDGVSITEELQVLDADHLGVDQLDTFADVVGGADTEAADPRAQSGAEHENVEPAAPDVLGTSGAKKATRQADETERSELVDGDVPALASEASEPLDTPGRDAEFRSDALNVAAPEASARAAAEVEARGGLGAAEVDVLGGVGAAVDDTLAETVSVGGSDGAISIETVLIVLGLVLAAGGALLLILIWLSRRTADPLLR